VNFNKREAKLNPERLRQVEHLYLEASDLDPNQRREFLVKACAGNELLLQEVESLLVHEEAAKSFMETPALQQQVSFLAKGWMKAPASMTGRTIGRYLVHERLGAGGMGEVYRAQDTRLARSVALKLLLPGLTAEEELRARFMREAKAASALNHPNIINIYDIDQVDGVDFIAMEYIEGCTLRSLIDSLELATAEALDYTVQIEMAPAFYLAYCVLGMAYVQLGMRHESIAALEKASKL
jgi:eukaryotic-like serine/threonine-protein kinase